MYQRDYILRMIEMIGELIAAISGYIRKKDFKQASMLINNAYQEYLKQDAAFFINIPKERLTRALIAEHNYTHGHLEILAELFFAEAELRFGQSNVQSALPYYEKALVLTEFILDESKTFSFEKQKRMDFLKNRIAAISGNNEGSTGKG